MAAEATRTMPRDPPGLAWNSLAAADDLAAFIKQLLLQAWHLGLLAATFAVKNGLVLLQSLPSWSSVCDVDGNFLASLESKHRAALIAGSHVLVIFALKT